MVHDAEYALERRSLQRESPRKTSDYRSDDDDRIHDQLPLVLELSNQVAKYR